LDAEITYIGLKNIALQEFPDVVVSASVLRGPLNVAKSLRIFLTDNSFLEIWISNDKYSYHWQRIDKKICRHDNAPHKKHNHIKTFPKHFHDGSEDNAIESNISDKPNNAIREFLKFVREKIK
tara:strand:- start:2529 stop:2897 length:369 start_codon:yes stop_codon:yes gene_type:complete